MTLLLFCMFARYYYSLGCCCHTPVWLAARWISCCRVSPSTTLVALVMLSTALHCIPDKLNSSQQACRIWLALTPRFLSSQKREALFLKQTAAKPSAVPCVLCIFRDANRLRVGRGVQGSGAGSRGLPVQCADLVQKTRLAWCWENALFGPKQVPFGVSWWSVLLNWLFLQLCPQQHLRERLGWEHCGCTAHLPCSPCLSGCIQTWAPGMWAQAGWLKACLCTLCGRVLNFSLALRSWLPSLFLLFVFWGLNQHLRSAPTLSQHRDLAAG